MPVAIRPYSPATKVVAPQGSTSKADYYTDGTADDVQIQAAIDAVEALGGGTVYIKRGTYDITDEMTVGSNVTIEGDGFATVIKHFAGSGQNGLFKNDDQVSGNTGIIIRNLAIDGNSANVTGSDPRDTIWLKLVTKSIVENLYIHDCADSAIVLDQAATNNNIVRNNIIDTTGDIGIYVSVASDNLITGNIVLNTGQYGIRNVNSGAVRNVYTNNFVYNCGQGGSVDGLLISNGDSCVVQGNFIRGSGRYGIHVASSAYTAINGNSVITSDQHGIYLNGAVRNQVSGNTVHQSGQTTSNTYSGIYLDGASECSVVGNRSGDSGASTRQKYGVEEAGAANTNLIMGNMVQRNATGGIITVGAATIAFGNSNYTTNTINGNLVPLTSDGAALGTTSLMFSDLFLASGGVLNFNNGNVTLTHSAGILTQNAGEFRITSANVGTNADSVPTLSSTSTLTNKTLTSPTITTPSAFTTGGVITLAENTSIALDPAGSADGKYSGTTVAGTGGDTIAFGDLVTLDKDDSRWEKVDISVAAAATGDARGIIGIAATSSTDGAAITVLLNGIIRADANFPALTIGAAVYASTTGDIVVTQPTTTDHVIRIVGYALTADEIYFCPDNDWITHT